MDGLTLLVSQRSNALLNGFDRLGVNELLDPVRPSTV